MDNKAWSLGRTDADCCDILLSGETISAVHASLNFLQGKFYLSDNGSSNGTQIKRNGQFIKVSDHIEIWPSDTLLFGQSEYSLDDLIDFSAQAKGHDIQQLTIVQGKATALNKAVSIDPQPLNSAIGKIRCYECSTIIAQNAPCPECGSATHL